MTFGAQELPTFSNKMLILETYSILIIPGRGPSNILSWTTG